MQVDILQAGRVRYRLDISQTRTTMQFQKEFITNHELAKNLSSQAQTKSRSIANKIPFYNEKIKRFSKLSEFGSYKPDWF